MILKTPSSQAWLAAVMNDFDNFLLDHASCEKKASGMAISILSHYPDKADIVLAMTDLALEELNHFRQVTQLIYQRGLQLGADQKDPYVNRLLKLIRKGAETYLQDRLLLAAIIEARGHERFSLIAEALPEGKMKQFYQAIARSEGKHYELFLDLAKKHTDTDKTQVDVRLEELLIAEAEIINQLPLTAALH